ncbi:MAG: ribosomal protein S18-alanine N-acetyltransferase [Oscillospiraceae bacterium]|nr:ribosomal protein S18-alanine N-acetyltransferase [Oscillospiraceae bacterium]
MEQWKIVPMERRHIPALARLERECFSDPWSEEGIAAELDNPLAVFRVAEGEGGEALGYAGMTHVLDEGYLDNVAVKEEFRGRGVGSSLLEALVAYAREREMAFLTLEVRQSNEKARRLYARYGFEEQGLRRGFYTHPEEDAVIMTLKF